ncbi:NmrA family NAD(P)-binding protein [Roseixanthobacter glucoisosaccharinicivorans]|uniref:NmrA family NAD(P)-binding protein n=1 Tax=Roseixanthobacter glucoisosaccharinicivorans TaxID=3119923 RepID=UPI003727AF6A
MNNPILIAGATGATGKVATQLLLNKGFSVRALVHRDDARSQALADAALRSSSAICSTFVP